MSEEAGFNLSTALENAGVLPEKINDLGLEVWRRVDAGYGAPMAALNSLKEDYRFADCFKPTTQGGTGGNHRNVVPDNGPAPGSVEAIAEAWKSRGGGGFGLAPIGQAPTNIAHRPAPPPAPEPWRPQHDQQAAAAGLATYCQNVVERGATGGPGARAGFGLTPIK